MLRHLLKLIWKRKGRNMMLSLEILLAFMVVFAIAAFGLRHWQLYQLPVGHNWRTQWAVAMLSSGGELPNDPAIFDNIKRSLLELPEVESVAFSSFSTYVMSRWSEEYTLPDGSAKLNIEGMAVSDDFFATTDMRLVAGRFFSKVDDGADAAPVVINRKLADKWFPGKDPIGQLYLLPREKEAPVRYRVVGVVEQFRSQGEYMDPVYFMLPRWVPGVGKEAANNIMLKIKPGTPRVFEAKLSARLKQIRSDWSYLAEPLADARDSIMRTQTLPLVILSVIAAFLLVMVAFGLFGVLWQNTTQRIPEIGLRRALGADTGSIYRQIATEQILLSSGAMLIALVLLVQLPLTQVMGDALNWPVFVGAVLLSAAVIYLLSLLCSLYPGWSAARLSPTQALHYE
ncbi:FtsX-like permease family protein [Duganella sp. FT80W]|uniref:FtsX-like permease family protein n=1 Tax=Duganella guangzhouensis TaxID=2666084 RepID=A0A6I2L937_9BURK|nr:ABC transporter permease [Duganella guangzhouensis]MRW94300.1 FtsX-like permease family protein [Duganella guangzhouensis]